MDQDKGNTYQEYNIIENVVILIWIEYAEKKFSLYLRTFNRIKVNNFILVADFN